MQLKEKQLVEDFYKSKFHKDTSIIEKYLDKDAVIYWNSSSGFFKLNYHDFAVMAEEMGKAFEGLSCEITHLLQEDNMVTVRFTYHVNTIEDPDEEGALAHFICIWEVKNNKLHEGHLISQPGDDSEENIASFLPKR
ncbi:nuclear transport factor 2 family protein [Mesonia aestuariivivens]|uniref:Nuclear transport factor 2 family protein n=1 Tax=Mesonia aestuariivivens TaxID=2796128 RepID=A0ABS6W4H4_9FLAO|nr:nuclear transport factor 2 family protein [Mesonia aestuariivivens]MBW2962768.1 nuclear transport factor 2 family protein [Mesonia aestuariivivens]